MLDAYIWRKTSIAREQKGEIFVISYWQNVSIFVKMEKRLRNSCLVFNCLCWTLRQAETLTDKQTDKQTEKQKNRKTERRSERQTDRQADGQTDRQADRQRHRETDRQTDRQTDRRTDGQSDTVKIWGHSDKFHMSFSFYSVRVKWKTWFEKTALNMSIRRVIFSSGQNLKPPFLCQYLMFFNDFFFTLVISFGSLL